MGSLADLAAVDRARAIALEEYRRRMAKLAAGSCPADAAERVWAETAGPFEEASALLRARLDPDGGIGALRSRGCTASLVASHIVEHGDTALFVRVLLALRDARGLAAEVALREVRELARSSDLVWAQRAALALGTWGPHDLLDALSDRLAGAHDLARAYGWKAAARERVEMLEVALAVGEARLGRNSERFAAAAIAAIEALGDPRIAVLIEAELVHAPPSRLRDRLLVRLQRIAPAVELVIVSSCERRVVGLRIPLVLERDLIVGTGLCVRWQVEDGPVLLNEGRRLRPGERFTIGTLELEFRQTR